MTIEIKTYMKTITHIDANKLAIGILDVLIDIKKEGKTPEFSVERFEELVQETHHVSKSDAEKVTEAVINTGIIRWEIFGNNFVI